MIKLGVIAGQFQRPWILSGVVRKVKAKFPGWSVVTLLMPGQPW